MLSQKKFRLPKDIPLEEYPTPETYLEEAQHLITEAQKQGLVLRVMGPIALHYYFPEHVELYRRLERLGERVFTDIDYASYGKFRGKLVPFFEKQGYELEKRSAMLSGGTRHIYYGGRVPMIDVFYDRLSYNHPIDYHGRLDVHSHCVSLTDLLLQKLQIVKINDKDIKDGMLLLLAAQVGEVENNMINVKYVTRLMSEDWGFYYTSTGNLAKITSSLDNVPALSDLQRDIIREKANHLRQAIEDAPKSGKWKGRAAVGDKKIWYNDVSDWE
jgi:hypothetical protein